MIRFVPIKCYEEVFTKIKWEKQFFKNQHQQIQQLQQKLQTQQLERAQVTNI